MTPKSSQKSKPQVRAKAYSYLRFSTPEQMRGDSFRRQTELAKKYAEGRGLDLDETLTFQDLGKSAFRSKNVKSGELRLFLDAVESGVVKEGSYLLVESLDRISRDAILSALHIFTGIIESGIILVTLIDNREFTEKSVNANPMDLIFSLITMMRAHEESATKSRRLKAVWENKRAKAKEKPITAKLPSWLSLDRAKGKIIVNKARAEVVKRIFKLTLKGVGQNSIAQTLNGEKVPVFGKGKHWHRSFIVKLLNNPAVVGKLVPHKNEYIEGKLTRLAQEPVENYYPTIIKPEVYAQVQDLASTRSPLRGRHSGKTLNNIFGSLARCPLCGSTMTLVNKGRGNGKSYLVCSKAKSGAGCKYKAVHYDKVESAFIENLPLLVGTIPTGGETGDSIDIRISQLQSNISASEAYLESLLDILSMTKGSPAVAQRIRDVETDLENMRVELEDLIAKSNTMTSEMVKRRVEELAANFRAPSAEQEVHSRSRATGRSPSKNDLSRRQADLTEVETEVQTESQPQLDRASVNALLRQLLSDVVVDYGQGLLLFKWKHGGESEAVFSFPEKPKARRKVKQGKNRKSRR